ncbi:hypothetical protein Bsp3421_000424 (plasmid) [Burkholderia sp. FERM BP-3421]|jgi:hypothetical protein|uniref:hypothetical protein n=1 Tax=Burkholderia sp. FERM BP-3421 TaxID=1494466 RepID=UPI00235DE4D0|nr:hypothetical protein [Burkholderia sp. FERM BP-3421]WDD90564.1 hypothetical protein Bsp3421_000424 [Burkholderia sp. FERM BP-3421]
MKTVAQLKEAMGDLQRRRSTLQREMAAFDALQREIVSLRQRSQADGEARRKLERLDALMKNGGQHLVDALVKQAGQAERCMQKIGEELQQLAAPAEAAPREVRQVAKFRRAFV